jgi:hypothetical protein
LPFVNTGRRQEFAKAFWAFAGDTLRLVAALGIHDSDMHTLLRQRVTNALAEPAIAVRHECDRTPEVHELSPARE